MRLILMDERLFKCICRHTKLRHNFEEGYCYGCWSKSIKLGNPISLMSRVSHEFKLDNLRLIEDLAKEKSLI